MVGTVDVLLGNLEDAVKADNKEAARAGLVAIAQATTASAGRRADPALDPDQRARQPVGARRPDHAGHRDRRQARRDHGAEGAGRRGHPLRRPAARPARGEGRARPADPGPRDPRDRPRRGQRRGDLRRLAPDAGPLARPGRPRRRPPDEDHPRRRRPPRLPRPPGPRPAAARQGHGRPTSRTSGTTRSPGWSTPARCTASTPYYGPFGDIADEVACEDQFRNAFLLGCVGTWSLHPKQIAIANRVFSPSVEDIRHARRVVAAMGDGTGAVMLDGKMEDDASLKQCLVMVELAEQLAAIDPELKKQYDAIDGRVSVRPPAAPLRPLHAGAPTSARWRRRRRSPATG